MKIFKTIFRLDFPLAYKILDKFGEYLELIKTRTDEKPFTKGSGNINLVEHSLSHTSKIGDNIFTLNLDLQAFYSVIEFQDGLDVDKLVKVPIFSFADEIIETLEEDHSSKYNRIGIRSYVISSREEFNFSKLRNYIWDLNKDLGNSLSDFFEEKNDICITFESKSEKEENIRLQLGPYQNNEKLKYFALNNEIQEGMIYDIDIWQKDISIPKLKLVEIIRNYQNIYINLIEKIESQILEAIK